MPQTAALNALQASFQLAALLHALHAPQDVPLAPAAPPQPAALVRLISALALRLTLALLVLLANSEGMRMPALHVMILAALVLRVDQLTVQHVFLHTIYPQLLVWHVIQHAALVPRGLQLPALLALLSTLSSRILVLPAQGRPIL